VAFAAVAALFLFATTSAKAAVTAFVIDESKSFMKIGEIIDATLLGVDGDPGTPGLQPSPSVAQFPDPDGLGPITGSDTTSIYGGLYVDITGTLVGGGSVMPVASSLNWRVNNTPGVGGIPGNFTPSDTAPPGYPDPPLPGMGPLGTQMMSNYGFTIGAPLLLFQVDYNLMASWLGPARPMAPGGAFPFAPGVDALLGTYGRIVFTSVFDADSGDVIGDPLAALGTAGATPGTIVPGPGAGELTLTIPIESSFTVTLSVTPPGGLPTPVPVTFLASGVIVAVSVVPEPSSMALLGCGIVGLVACGYRLRKRRV
jgi:hypothetical protein